MPKLKPGTVIPTPEENAVINKGAHEDPDAVPYTDEEWTAARTKHATGGHVEESQSPPPKLGVRG